MRSGPLRHRMTIRTLTRTDDDFGGAARVDTDGDTVWASLTPLSASELYRWGQLYQNAKYKIRTRYRDDIEQGMTVRIEGTDYYVLTTLNPDARKRELEIVARDGGPVDG